MDYFAHSANHSGKRHLLPDHLLGVAKNAAVFATPFGASKLAAYTGYWHDIGKFDPQFQRYLLQAEQHLARPGSGPDHKAAGAVLAMQSNLELLAFVLVGHHGGLPSWKKLKVWLLEHSQEHAVKDAIMLAKAHIPDLVCGESLSELIPSFITTPSEAELFIRMLYSALVDADFLDTEKHFRADRADLRRTSPTMSYLWETYQVYRQQYFHAVRPSVINTRRQQVYQQCCVAASLPPGLFRLTVPTGGGKTLSSLAFALLHGVTHGLHRIIYAIPFLSITEQVADVFRAIFPDPTIVLEHHSGVEPPDTSQNGVPEQQWQRLSAENWDASLIVTTTVQLFESLLSRKPSTCRKLHALAESVLVLDEPQLLPAYLLETILDVLQQLVRHYRVTVVLCTATQPAFEQRTGFAGLQDIREIIPDVPSLFADLHRVQYHWPALGSKCKWTWKQVAERAQAYPQALVLVNTRTDAVMAAEAFSAAEPLHLSTTMCGAHRRFVLQTIRQRLDTQQECFVVSTPLIEAGVDLDFPAVLRAIGPLERIAQVAGRCNREGRLEYGMVEIFDPLEGSLPGGPYQTATELTQMVLQQGSFDLSDPALYQKYFQRYYALVDQDERHIQALRAQLEYPEVESRFYLIEKDTVAVIVPYHQPDSPSVVGGYVRALVEHPEEAQSFLRQLQPYIIMLSKQEVQWAVAQAFVEELRPGLYCCKEESYHPRYGFLLRQSREKLQASRE